MPLVFNRAYDMLKFCQMSLYSILKFPWDNPGQIYQYSYIRVHFILLSCIG